MMIQSPQLAAPALAQWEAPPQGAYPDAGVVVIGQRALQPKDATVLRALVRLLDGSLGMTLRYSDELSACHLVFVSAASSADGVGETRIWVRDSPLACRLPADAIAVASPLRMGAVIGALQQAFSRLRPRASNGQAQCLSALFERCLQALKVGGFSTLPWGAGQLIQIDAASQSLRATLPLDGLLPQLHSLGAPRTSHAFDEQRLRGAPTHCLRSWLWQLSAHMLRMQAAHPPLSGAWRLRRWPQAAGLMAPGHPQWAALLARRSYSVAELAQRCAAEQPAVLAFMATSEALGLLQPDLAAVKPEPSSPADKPAPVGWLQQMRVALGLW